LGIGGIGPKSTTVPVFSGMWSHPYITFFQTPDTHIIAECAPAPIRGALVMVRSFILISNQSIIYPVEDVANVDGFRHHAGICSRCRILSRARPQLAYSRAQLAAHVGEREYNYSHVYIWRLTDTRGRLDCPLWPCYFSKCTFGGRSEPVLSMLFSIFLVPESPRWLMAKGKYPAAFRSMERLRSTQIQAAKVSIVHLSCRLI
jgi:hypothetical protein